MSPTSLSGNATPTASTAPDADTTSLASILRAALPTAAASPPQSPKTASLLTTLTQQLQSLKDQLDAGQTPAPDDLKKLSDTVDALAALLVPVAQPLAIDPQTPSTPASTVDAIGAIGDTSPSLPAAPTLPPALPLPMAPPSDPAPSADSADVLSATQTSPTTPAAPTTSVDTTATVPAPSQPGTPAADTTALTALASKLEDLSQSLATVAPDLSRKLDTLSQSVTTTAANPQAVTQLDQQVAAAGTTLTDILKPLLPASPSPAATTIATAQPQLAPATASLPLPPAPVSESKQAPKPTTTSDNQTDSSTASPKLSVTQTVTANAVPAPDPAPKAAGSAPDDKSAPQPDPITTPSVIADASSGPATIAAAAPPTDTSAAKPLPAAYQSAQNPINMGQVAFEMMRQVQQGSSRFTIRLDPPELGRVDVKMHVDPTGTVSARLTVDRVETLDMFQRDRGTLERALSQAGLDSGKTSLEFSLRQNPFAGMTGGNQQQASTTGTAPSFSLSPSEDDTSAVPAVTLFRGVASTGGVNLFV